MKKSLVVCLAIALSSSMAMAQQAPAASSNAATTATRQANPAARLFTQEQFEKRWKVEEQMYKDAGIGEEKIKKLHDLNAEVWKARAEGNKADFQKIMKERQQVLSQEEVQKIRDLRRKKMESQLGKRRGLTTATRSAAPATTASAAN